MNFTLQRIEEVDSEGVTGVTGTLTGDIEPGEQFNCVTLEHKDVLLPAGTYPLIPGHMESHNADRAELQDIPGHSGVFIHSGNKAADSKMCPLVGGSRPTPGTITGGMPIADHIFQMVKNDPAPSQITVIDFTPLVAETGDA